ncbi:unnamed protein product [marine sediment metagenome]|uniref:Uncharacterized protein n=1 Tax=marine sediment metagenome TaxID=412755 RepID=X1G9H8_9ZZZZ
MVPLLTIAVFTLVAGGAIANWYWSSQSISSVPIVVIEGWVEAKCSVDPRSVWVDSATKTAYADLVEINVLLLGEDVGLTPGMQYLFFTVDSTDLGSLYLRLTGTVPPGMLVSAYASYYSIFSDGSYADFNGGLGQITLDGATSIDLTWLEDPLFLIHQDVAGSVLLVGIEFDISAGTLGAGSWSISDLTVHLGDAP